MGIEIATLLGYISQTGGNSKINSSRSGGHVSRGVNHAITSYHSRDDIGREVCSGEQNLDLDVLTRGRKTYDQFRWHGWLCLIVHIATSSVEKIFQFFEGNLYSQFCYADGLLSTQNKNVLVVFWGGIFRGLFVTFTLNRAFFRELISYGKYYSWFTSLYWWLIFDLSYIKRPETG